jgi:putative ABC transport system ATP-binding protein
MIQLRNIWKEYQINKEETFIALKGVDVEIKEGEFTAITGPSGSGKSTLMHIIGLLDKPTRGEILINKKSILEMDDNELSTFRSEFVGFVFQQFNLINKLTVLENVMLPTIYARKKLDYDPEERALYLLERFGIKEKQNSYPNKISGGQQQRVAIARSLIMNPMLILADEPTGNLDTKTGDEIMKLLSELNKNEKRTIIVVTHEMDIAEKTRRIIQVRDGEIVK